MGRSKRSATLLMTWVDVFFLKQHCWNSLKSRLMTNKMGVFSPRPSCSVKILAADGSVGEVKVLMRLCACLQKIESFLHVAVKNFVFVILVIET